MEVPPPPPPEGLLTALDPPPALEALLDAAAAEDVGVLFDGVSGTVGFVGVDGVVGFSGVVGGVVVGVVGGVVFFGSCLLVISTLPSLSVLPVSLPPLAFVTLYDAV